MPVTQIAVVPGPAGGGAAAKTEAEVPGSAESRGSEKPSSASSHRALKTRSLSEKHKTTSSNHAELRTLSSPAMPSASPYAMPFIVCQSNTYLPGSVTDVDLPPSGVATTTSSTTSSTNSSNSNSSSSSVRPSSSNSISHSIGKRVSIGSKSWGKAIQRPGSRGSQPRPTHDPLSSTPSLLSNQSDICRICHCEGDEEMPLIHPCLCLGSLQFVHQACIQQWIKSSNTKSCELCRFDFIMQSKLKPFGKWEKLDMSTGEKRKIVCSVSFHLIAVTCVIWALYVLIERTTAEFEDDMKWPFWTKLVVVAVGFTGGLVFMYVQCKVYVQLWKRLKAYNRVIYVQNCPPEVRSKAKELQSGLGESPKSQMDIIN